MSGLPGQFAHDPRVLLGQRQGHVARHGGDAQHLDILGRGQRQQDRHRVILSGVGVDDDLARGHGFVLFLLAPKLACQGGQGQGAQTRPMSPSSR